MDPDGRTQRNLSNNKAVDSAPAWSPDGTLIAFHSDRDGNFEIYVMNADGTNQRRLTHDPPLASTPHGRPTASNSPSRAPGTETPSSTR
jgi:Tol biopolymer transport system component